MDFSGYYSILSVEFWKAFWMTMRPYLIFVSGAAGLVGLAFIPSPGTLRAVLAFVPLFFSYGLGQALTDCFQTDTDAISSPFRPMIQGIVSPMQVFAVSLAGLFLVLLILVYLNPHILFFGLAAVLGLLGYTTFKKRWWGGPFWNSWIVALLPIMGRMTGPEARFLEYFSPDTTGSDAFLYAVIAILFAYGNFVVMGYLKDVSADRQTGYKTFPVVFGWKATVIYSDCLGLTAALFFGAALFKLETPKAPALSIFGIAFLVNLFAQIKIHRTSSEEEAFGPIANVVRAFILYSLALVVALQLTWLGFIVVFYLCFEIALKFRPKKSQV